MRDLIPFIQSEEQRQTQEEIKGREVSVIFDGTTHVAEAMAIVVRYVSRDWKITAFSSCTASDKDHVWRRGST